MPRPLPFLIAVAALSAPLVAHAAPLKIGSTAPALKVSKWVKGTPVTGFVKGKIYVVEFWATWCGPCIQSIPHISELAKQYKGKVTFTGVSVWERDPKHIAKVKAFVDKMGTKMSYNVATDTDPSGGYMAKSWMEAAQQGGIPTAFVIGKDGKIAWIGHPMEMEKPLAAIVAGKYDAKAEAANFAKAQAAQKARDIANKKVGAFARAGKWVEAVAELERLSKSYPDLALESAPLKFALLLRSGDESKAFDFAESLLALKGPRMADLLGILAHQIIDNESVKTRDLAIALKLAQKAVTNSSEKDWELLDILARAQEKNGDISSAIATETKAIHLMSQDVAVSESAKKELTDRLAALRAKAQ